MRPTFHVFALFYDSFLIIQCFICNLSEFKTENNLVKSKIFRFSFIYL